MKRTVFGALDYDGLAERITAAYRKDKMLAICKKVKECSCTNQNGIVYLQIQDNENNQLPTFKFTPKEARSIATMLLNQAEGAEYSSSIQVSNLNIPMPEGAAIPAQE